MPRVASNDVVSIAEFFKDLALKGNQPPRRGQRRMAQTIRNSPTQTAE